MASLRIALSILLVSTVAACGGGGGDDDSTPTADAAAGPDVDPLAPDADPTAPDADPAAPDAGPVTASLDAICNPTDGFAVRVQAVIESCNGYTVAELGGLTPAQTSAACYGVARPYLDDGELALGDQAAFAACAAYIDALTCENFSAHNPCTALLTGQQAQGATCFEGQQCGPGLRCDNPPSGTFCHTCTATGTSPLQCNTDAQCGGGGAVCVCQGPSCFGQCATQPTLVAPGQACDFFTDTCAGLYQCRIQSDGAGKCVTLPATATMGGRCRDDLDCAGKNTGLFCKDVAMPGMSPSYQCQPYIALDAVCQPGVNKCNPWMGHDCQFDGVGAFKCLVPTPAALGQACGPPCAAGLACDSSTGTCKNARTEGQTMNLATDVCVAGTHRVIPLTGTSTCEYSDHRDMCSPL